VDPNGRGVVDFLTGAVNAWASDNLAGGGRQEQTTESGKVGAAVGDFVATVQGAVEDVVGGGGEAAGFALDSTGAGAIVGVPVNVASAELLVHGTTTLGVAGGHLLAAAADSSKAAYDENDPKNQERMSQGKAPISDKDGHPVELHHDGQKPNGQLQEMNRTDHREGENFSKNHPNTGKKPSEIDRAQFKKDRQRYWKNKGKCSGMKTNPTQGTTQPCGE